MKIKILSSNCWLLPPPFSVENRKRLKKLIGLIRKTNPDIIALQEVWLNKYVSLLKKGFSDYFAVSLNKGFFNKTGLVTLSKLKPNSVDFYFFKKTKKHSLVESFAKKGYQKIIFDIGQKKLAFINTHLYAPVLELEEKMAAQQFNEIKRNCKDKNLILAGDLNIRKSDFKRFNPGLFCYKPDKNSDERLLDIYRKIKFNRIVRYDDRVNYILPKQKSQFKVKNIVSPIISDHFPIEAILDI